MENKIIYKTGQKLGNLEYISEVDAHVRPNGGTRRKAIFRCNCGKEFICLIESIKYGNTTSCGCLVNRKGGKTTHGHTTKVNNLRTTEFIIWQGMIARCGGYKTGRKYKRYAARGINVCEKWLNSFDDFLKDMGFRPSKNHSLDRIDNNGNYCPENCRWATIKEQNRNKSTNRLVTFNGKTQCISDWAEEIGINRATLYDRIENWPIEKALTTPLMRKNKNIA